MVSPQPNTSNGDEVGITESGRAVSNRENNLAPINVSGYTLDAYQYDAESTAIYPGAGSGSPTAVSYVLLKLAGEAGEVGQAYAKYLRGDYNYSEFLSRAKKELGDVLWYISAAAIEIDENLSDIAADNIAKLADRESRGVIRGTGDKR